MPKFMVLYQAEASFADMAASMTAEQSQAGMALWMAWAQACGDSLVDLGSPLCAGTRVAGGVADPSSIQVCGYSIVEARTLDDATALVTGHPHFHTPGNPSIEVLPYLAIQGM